MELKPLEKVYRYLYENGRVREENTTCYTILYAAMKEYCKEYVGGRYLEIGVNYGHSAYCAWESFRPSEMVLCDLFEVRNMIPIVERTLNVIDCKSDVVFVVGDTAKTLDHVNSKFDVILVDGDHSYKGALRDLNKAWCLLKHGGLLLFDDIELTRLSDAIELFASSRKKQISMFKIHREFKRGIAVLKRMEK